MLNATPKAGNEHELQTAISRLRRKHHFTPKKSQLTLVYTRLVASGAIAGSERLRALLLKNPSKSQSGVLVITVQKFTLLFMT